MHTLLARTVAVRARQASTAAAAAAVLTCLLTGCGGGGDSGQSDPTTAAAASVAESTSSAVPDAASAAAAPAALSASLRWPEGTADFAVDLCASQGPSTIQGGGSSAEWKLFFDANLLDPGDTGTLQVSNASDMTVAYDADITELTVQPDGTFEATGQDAGGAQFHLTGTCDISW